MTAPAPSPASPQDGADVVKNRGMVGFYFAWTPLRIWYWEREVRRRGWSSVTTEGPGPDGTWVRKTPRINAARELLRLGPAAEPAVRRLLEVDDDGDRLPEDVLHAFSRREDKWALPLLIEIAGDKNSYVYYGAIYAAERVTRRKFFPPVRHINELSGWGAARRWREQARKNLLDWWEKEGRAEYGRDAE